MPIQPNITLPIGPVIREYHALLNQSGTNDPTTIVLHNTLGFEPVWERNNAGIYFPSGTYSLNRDKTTVIITSTNDQTIVAPGGYDTNGLFFILQRNPYNNTRVDNMINVSIVIRVYDV